MDNAKPDAKPLIIYHRGRHGGEIAENSLAAFEIAIREGAKMIEFDVQEGLLIAHDPNPWRNITTLEAALAQINGRCAVNIEIKQVAQETLGDIMETVCRAIGTGRWSAKQFVISSFDLHTACWVKSSYRHIRVGMIYQDVPSTALIDALAAYGIDNLHLSQGAADRDREGGCLIQKTARKHQMQIWIWTVNDLEMYQQVVEYGADAIFTDKPELFRSPV